MTTIGRCTRCRGPVTVLKEYKVEAYAGDARPVLAKLCDPCADKTQKAKLTPVNFQEEKRELTEMYV